MTSLSPEWIQSGGMSPNDKSLAVLVFERAYRVATDFRHNKNGKTSVSLVMPAMSLSLRHCSNLGDAHNIECKFKLKRPLSNVKYQQYHVLCYYTILDAY